MKKRRDIDWQAARASIERVRQSLDRDEVSPEARGHIFRQRAEALARPLAAPADLAQLQNTPRDLWLDGAIASAVPLSEVVNVIADAPITPVPGAPARVAGEMQVRGEIRPVYQLKELLGEITAESQDTVVLVRHRNREVGLRVGRVEDIRALSPGEFQDAPPGNPRIKQLTVDMVPVLDLAGPLQRA